MAKPDSVKAAAKAAAAALRSLAAAITASAKEQEPPIKLIELRAASPSEADTDLLNAATALDTFANSA